MLTYSIVIRTLGTAGDKFRQELISLSKQTVAPDKIIVYIAEGYARPDFTIGKEEYRWVKKGMMAQRLLPYDDIDSDCLMMLDDDIYFASDSAERMLSAMEQYGADCIGVDIFKNHRLPATTKLYAAITNWVLPHKDENWAFKIHRHGAFSYINRPSKSFYWSQSCPGAISLWRKSVYHQLRMTDELWLEKMGFPYADDALESYKVYRNGYKLGVLFDAGVENLNAASSSAAFRRSPNYFYSRTKAMVCVWWRSCFMPSGHKTATALSFLLKIIWLFIVMSVAAIARRQLSVIPHYIKGLRDSWDFIHHNQDFVCLPNYIVSQ